MIAALAASMGLSATDPAFWMPLLLMTLMLSLVLGAILFDGFDIGVGLLLPSAPLAARPALMVALSPWRDANEFWALLAVGLFMSAFPFAWSAMLSHLYVPLAFTMIGVMLRSVAFEFRIRAATEDRWAWIWLFWLGSVLTAAGHGMLLAAIVTGYEEDAPAFWFNLFIAICAIASYALLGATWLVMRLEGQLQLLAMGWARHAMRWSAAGMAAVSIALGLANPAIFYRWSSATRLALAAPIWFVMLFCMVGIDMMLPRVIQPKYRGLAWLPFALAATLFTLMLCGLVYSMFPFVILDDLTLWDAASAIGSLRLVLAATVVAVPVMVVFNLLGYRGMFGRAR